MKSRAETFASIQEKSQRALAERERNRKNIVKISLTAACLVLMVSAALPNLINGRAKSESAVEYSYKFQQVNDELSEDNYQFGQYDSLDTDDLTDSGIDSLPKRVKITDQSSGKEFYLSQDEIAELCRLMESLEMAKSNKTYSRGSYSLELDYTDRTEEVSVYGEAVCVDDGAKKYMMNGSEKTFDELFRLLKSICAK